MDEETELQKDKEDLYHSGQANYCNLQHKNYSGLAQCLLHLSLKS